MGMFARALQISLLWSHVTCIYIALYSIYCLKAIGRIKHEKQYQCLISSEAQLYFLLGYKAALHCVHVFLTRGYLTSKDSTDEMNSEKSFSAHLLWRNRHGPMVVQRCFAAGINFSGKFALASCFELPKQTSFWPDFVRNDVTSVRSSILFEVYRSLQESQILATSWNIWPK